MSTKRDYTPMNTNEQKRIKRNLATFILVVLGMAVLAGLIEPFTVPPGAEPGASGLGQLVWLITPFLMTLAMYIFGGGWSDLGLRPNFKGNGFWWLVSILAFPVVILISTIFGALLGGVIFNAALMPTFAASLIPAFTAAAFKNIFEEFAWRGYLAPKVYSLNLNTWLSHGLVGLVWGIWHLPFVYAFWVYPTPNMLWYFIPFLLLGTISQSVVYGEIRLATNSVWPAWLMHTIGNALGNALLLNSFILLKTGKEIWFTPGAEGVVSIILFFTIGYMLHLRRKKVIQGQE